MARTQLRGGSQLKKPDEVKPVDNKPEVKPEDSKS